MPELQATIGDNGAVAVIRWNDGHERKCSAKWLRFHCHCEKCKPAFSGMYPLDRSAFGDTIALKSIDVCESELRCAIYKDLDPEHVTVIPLSYLKQNCNCESCLRNELSNRKATPVNSKSAVPSVEYADTLTDKGMFRCLEKIIHSGFCVVKHAPMKSQKEVADYVRKIGTLRNSFYDETWEVKSHIDPINAAYTNIKLVSHQDIPVYEAAPGVQILHTLRFDETVLGGESKIVDLLQCADILRTKHPDHFKTLCTIPAAFVTIDYERKIPAWFEHRKPHIEVDYFGEVVAVNWHPNLEGTLRIREKDMVSYYHAYKTFLNIVQDAEIQLVFRLQPGDCFIFNNHRMAHAREAYSAGSTGDRHLLGCYANIEDVKSHYMALADKLGVAATPKGISNRSSF